MKRDVVLSGVDNVRTNFGVICALKIWDSENVRNLVRFRTTFNFECEYLWNGWRYRQAVNGVINYHPFHVEQKKFGELWSTNDNV